MSKNHISEITPNTDLEKLTTDLKSEYYDGISAISYHLNIDGKKLNEQQAYSYMKYIYENVNKSNSFIMAHTGYKRSTVENFKKKYESTRLAGPKKETNIFFSFYHKLRKACKENDDYTLAIHGPTSCHSIFDSCKFSKNNTYTVNSVLSTLEKSGIIEIHKYHIKFTQTFAKKHQRTNDDLNRQFSNVVRDFSSTQIHNKYEDDHDKRLFSQRIFSVDIPDESLKETVKKMNEILKTAHKQCFEMLEEIEDLSNDQNKTYEVGVQLYTYKIKRGKS